MAPIAVADLAAVIYSAGKVFDRLATGRLATEQFLRSGSTDGIHSRADLELLKDLRDGARFILADRGRPVDHEFVREVNAQLTRSAALNPGRLRSADANIGVSTRYGRHLPRALSDEDLQNLVEFSMEHPSPHEQALHLFVNLAKAQPFEDGNKRTALFVANRVLLAHRTGDLLTIPVSETTPGVADEFNDRLARAYVLNDHAPTLELLRSSGFAPLPRSNAASFDPHTATSGQASRTPDERAANDPGPQ